MPGKDTVMSKQNMMTLAAVTASIWLGSLAWLSGYKQGYSEGADTAWDDARSALSPDIPVLNIDSIKLSSSDYNESQYTQE